METELEHNLIHLSRADIIAYLGTHPENFDELLTLSLSDKQPYSWKASWILSCCMIADDVFVRPCIEKIITLLPTVDKSQQRMLLMILQKMNIDNKDEIKLFRICVAIWENIKEAQSLRYNALKMLLKIANNNPDFQNKLAALTLPQYTNSLTTGTKHSVALLIKKAKINLEII